MKAKNGSQVKKGDNINGFVIRRVVEIPEIRVCAYEAQHVKTGADFIHLHCEDSENLFATTFKTPPWDSTGLPHIIEHSVLAGSERYPLKDVFNELIKGSLQTFLNAFTYPDKTVYPVASQIKKDFYNLAGVYTDLVFNPRLLRETFWQEAHHLKMSASAEKSSKNNKLGISGVVYNEMKGAYASVNSLAFKVLQENLYPNTPYAFDSGGDPSAIPRLTYERFCEYHRAHYSPHNSLFFFYGDIPTREHLEFLGGIIERYENTAMAKIVIPKQRHWRKPRQAQARYPLKAGEKETAIVNIAWLLHDATDIQKGTLLSLLSALLIGSAASPLRKALLSSRWGEDLSPASGSEREMRQTAFCVGLRGVGIDNIGKVEGCVLETLARIAADGFDEELIEGVFHQAEFAGREIIRKAYPYGIALLGVVLQSWLYDGDALAGLNFPRLITAVRGELAKNPRLFNELIKEWLLSNPHRLTAILLPDTKLLARQEAALRRELRALEKSLSPAQLEENRRINQIVDSYQNEKNSAEVIGRLPMVDITDIPRTVETIPVHRETGNHNAYRRGGISDGNNKTCQAIAPKAASAQVTPTDIAPLVLEHNIFTNGICYLDIAFALPALAAGQLAALPLFARSIVKLGANGCSYDQIAKKIARYTGGITASVACGARVESGDWRRLIISVKMLPKNIEPALELISELILLGRLDESKRMEELVLEAKNGIAAAMIPSGHLFAKMSATAGISELGYLEEILSGKSQLDYLNNIAANFTLPSDALLEMLSALRKATLRKTGAIINITAAADDAANIENAAQKLFAAMPIGGSNGALSIGHDAHNIAVAIPADVCFVAKAMSAPDYAHRLAPYLLVLSSLLSNGYLYREVRAIGGAYGGFASYDISGGVFALLSYRDPHLKRTIDIFEKIPEALPALLANTDEVKKAIIATAGRLDKPLDPASKGYTSLIRHLAGLDDERRQAFREAILETSVENIREAGEFLFAQAQSSYAIYASETRLKKELPAELEFTLR